MAIMARIYYNLIKKDLRKLEDIKDEELKAEVQALLDADNMEE